MSKDQEKIFLQLKTLLQNTIPENGLLKGKCEAQLNSANLTKILYENSDYTYPITNNNGVVILVDTFNSVCDSYSGDKAELRNVFKEWLKNVCSKVGIASPELRQQPSRGNTIWCNELHEPTTTKAISKKTRLAKNWVTKNINTVPGVRDTLSEGKPCIYTPNRIQGFQQMFFNSSEIGELFCCFARAYFSKFQDNLKIKKIALDYYVQLTNYQKHTILPRFYSVNNNLEEFCTLLNKASIHHQIEVTTEEEQFAQAKNVKATRSLLYTAIKQSAANNRVDILYKGSNDNLILIEDCAISVLYRYDEQDASEIFIIRTKNSEEIKITADMVEDVIIVFEK